MSSSDSTSDSDSDNEDDPSDKIDKLIRDAANLSNNKTHPGAVPLRFRFNPNDVTLRAAKEQLGLSVLLQHLKQFQCQSDNMIDDGFDNEELYKPCTRLGLVFSPNNKPGMPHFDKNYDGEDTLDYSRVKKYCTACFNAHRLQYEVEYDDFWFGKEFENYTGLSGVRRIIDTGRAPIIPGLWLGGRGMCLEGDYFNTSKYPLLCGNQTTTAAMFLVEAQIWKIYWSLIKKHCLSEKEVEKIEARAKELLKENDASSDESDSNVEHNTSSKPSASGGTTTTRRIIKAKRPVKSEK